MGAWIETYYEFEYKGSVLVAPYVGAWIETISYDVEDGAPMSHPTWVRGLKLLSINNNHSNTQSRTLRGCVD